MVKKLIKFFSLVHKWLVDWAYSMYIFDSDGGTQWFQTCIEDGISKKRASNLEYNWPPARADGAEMR